MNKIDIVVAWVDGSDPAWQQEKAKYMGIKADDGAANNRYRDWGLMPYFFRGIEQFAPWVNHVYFVTCGHVPEWLNLDHPKLTHVKHEDYIPKQYLPTFNSNVIEWYYHKIPGLSEQFILLNDDMFLIYKTKPEDFFANGKARDICVFDTIHQPHTDDIFAHTLLNNNGVINKHFHKLSVIKKQLPNFFHPAYKGALLRNFLLLPFKSFTGFYELHIHSNMFKSTYETLWEKEPEILTRTMQSRFRSADNVMQWLVKNWQICEGKATPMPVSFGKKLELGEDDKEIFAAIKKQKYKVLCINDSSENIDFNRTKKALTACFETILPEKSSYEI